MWLVLVASGLLEAVWATALGASEGLRRAGPSALFVVAATGSMVGLSIAMTEIPTGTAYAVWVGIGAALTAIYPIVRGKERLGMARGVLLLGLVGSLIGLKAVA